MRSGIEGYGAGRSHAGESIGHGLSNGFDTWLGRHRLASLTFQAVADGSWLIPEANSQSESDAAPVIPSEKMMVLITYCYAIGICDSAEIAASISHDAILRDICAGMRPTPESIRQFRWTHSHAISRALSQVLRKASAS